MGGEKVFYLKGRLQRVKRADTAIAAVHVGSRSDGQLKCCEARIEHNPSPIFNSLSQVRLAAVACRPPPTANDGLLCVRYCFTTPPTASQPHVHSVCNALGLGERQRTLVNHGAASLATCALADAALDGGGHWSLHRLAHVPRGQRADGFFGVG